MPAPGAAAGSQRVFLHVGPPKTGTTYVQSVLWTNRKDLREAGVLLPGRGRTAHFSASGDLRGRVKARGGGGGRLTGRWDRLAAEVRDWPGTSVISCEWLAPASDQQIARALASFGSAEVHVVATLRDLGRVVPAVWQEQVKNGKSFTMSEFLDLLVHPAPDSYGELFWSVQDPRQMVGRWGRHLPPDRVHVVTLPGSGAAPDELWTRFSSLFLSDSSAYDTTSVRANPGLDPAAAELLRRVNADLGGRMRKASHSPLVKQLLHGELTKEQSGRKTRLPVEAVAPIAATAQAAVEWLRGSGHDVVGELDELGVDTTPRETSLPEDSPEDEVSRAAVHAMTALLLTMQADGAHKRKVWRNQDGADQSGGPSDSEAPAESDASPSGGPVTPRARALSVARRATRVGRRAAGAARRRVAGG
ncbi:MAG: hypothetical protein M3529_09660 [Actinomycetota bacterium]|nr:hypothetical protein [Actinomycetota bacterium]